MIRMIKDRKKIRQTIEEKIMKDNPYELLNGKTCFKTSSNGYVRLDTIGDDYNCVVIEFAENKSEAKNNRFEDGDLFDVDEFSIEEIEKIVRQQIIDN